MRRIACLVAVALIPAFGFAEDGKGDKSAKWDVAKAGTTEGGADWGWKDVSLDTDEGTWMSLDVSPDGQTIVFDLMGDLYTMPIGGSPDGSQVKCIAEGVQWDMQPRFSPDGKWLAFVSDRTGENGKGGDNIWVMKSDGAGGWIEPRQITKETFRLLTQPVWTPDSKNIVARKHFTSRRSLGAGEMWMYSVSGKTDGLQLTAKQSDQKDTGEPAVSPDGRYLYYSLDASNNANFEYDKDGNAGIYAIDRLDLKTNETERIIAGPGGACRPVPSPDGRSVAFVRRVRYQSTLFVMDLESQKARPIYSEMERDNQETWAVHGVYPAMAWTPDGKSLVFWAKGKIHRVDADTGKSEVIPFRVRNVRKIAEAARFPIEVAPATFDVKMLQNTEVSPTGDRVVFQALGHLYVASLKDGVVGEPKRLTDESQAFEFFPTWSRDGSKIAYCTWNDEQLGSVRVISATGGSSKLLTAEPGHYTNPAFSPDGSTLVYQKTSGGYITSPLWGRETGIYSVSVPADGVAIAVMPKVNLISKRGGAPHFGKDNDRVFLMTRDGGKDSDKVSLISVPVAGETPEQTIRTHYTSDWATEMRVSPDGSTLAFAERYNVFVTPFIEAGKPVEVSPKASGVLVTKVTSDAGNFIHWSGDSTKLHWTLGPDLSTVSVTEAIAKAGEPAAPKIADDKNEAAKSEAKKDDGVKAVISHIRLTATQEVPKKADGTTSVIAIKNVKVLTMRDSGTTTAGRGMEVIENGTIVIEGNRITAVGPAADVTVPAGAEVIDGKGGVVTPGIIDVHAHGAQGENGFTPQKNWISHANLAFGVTTIHDPSNDTEMIFAASELAKTGAIISPRVYSTGTILYGAAGAYKAEIESVDDAMFHLKRMQAVGAFSVKSYNQPRRDQRQMVMEAARRLKMMVVPEGGALYQHNMSMVVDGHTSVEHTLPVENIYKDAETIWGASYTGYTPTLGVAYGGMGGENYWYAKTNVWENEHLMRFVPRYVVDPRSRRRTDAPDIEWNHIKESQVAKKVLDAKTSGVGQNRTKNYGGPTLGAHGQLAGLAAHWELWMFVQGGMTPHEALRAGTIDGAWIIGMEKDIGSLAPGKLADLILFKEDVSKDIRKTDSISMVMLNGRLYNAADLAQIAPVKTEAPRYFFEELQRGSSTPLALEAIMRAAQINGGTCEACGQH
jgi:imidazolonepropionase-like amidohydrolase/Tol biopolymer transport system component